MSVHHLQLFAEDGEIRSRLTCTATPDAVCRRRPVDPELESWTDEDETTPGHECWAVEWIETVGDWPDGSYVETDGILSSVDVEVSYEDGPIISLTTPQPTLPDLAGPTDAEVEAAARAIDPDAWSSGITMTDNGMTPQGYRRKRQHDARTKARAALVAAREVSGR